ncbi:hypothetical protein ACHAWF_011137 [Thalassiosira exigua]
MHDPLATPMTFIGWRSGCLRLIEMSFLFFVCLALQLHRTHSFSMSYDPNMKTKIASSVAKTERRERERSHVGREICIGCNRPTPLCVCPSLPEKLIETSTSVLILQHPRERRRRSLSTVPLMPLVLEKCSLKVGYQFTLEDINQFTKGLRRGQRPLLMFPGPDAISLDGSDGAEFAQHLENEEQLLILIDGTWAEAKRIIMQSPELIDSCQKIQFQSETESIYPIQLRKEPEKHCLSTLESCAHALMILEPSSERATKAKKFLEGSMKCMVERRLDVSDSRDRAPRFSRPNAKIFEKNRRRHQIKRQLFS